MPVFFCYLLENIGVFNIEKWLEQNTAGVGNCKRALSFLFLFRVLVQKMVLQTESEEYARTNLVHCAYEGIVGPHVLHSEAAAEGLPAGWAPGWPHAQHAFKACAAECVLAG